MSPASPFSDNLPLLMAEARGTDPGAAAGPGARTGAGFELRLERGGVHVVLPKPVQVGGVEVLGLDLQVPDVTLPFDPGSGPGQFQSRLCELCRLEVSLAPEVAAAAAARLDLGAFGLEALAVGLRQGFVEVAGRLAGGPAFALRLGLLAGFQRGVEVIPYAPRLLGPSARPAAALPHLAAGALSRLGLAADPLPALLRRILVPRGWKVPAEGTARLALAAVTPAGVRLAWDRDPPGPSAPPADPALLATVEGARAFEAAEALLAAGELAGARQAYLGAPAQEHPFAAERLLSLLCLDPADHPQALSLAAGWLARRPGFGPALAARAWIFGARGQGEAAADALSRLAEEAVAAGERLAAVAAAEAALALPGAGREARARAVDAALAVQRDHLPALRALRALAREAGDPGAHLRAVRRLLAYAPSDQEKAQAHAELGELLLERDPPAARLHLDRALKLAPDDPEALLTLARACQVAGEHLRAVGALDRLRALRLAAGALDSAARLALEAGAIWEHQLDHPENAGLRYREAADQGGAVAVEAHRGAARCAERLGRWLDAADHHAAALAHLDRATPGAGAQVRALHLALAGLAEERLGNPAAAAAHLQAALDGAPPDPAALARLVALLRRLDRPLELAAALEQQAGLEGEPGARAAGLAEAGHLLAATGHAGEAQARFGAALDLDPACPAALDGLTALAAEAGEADPALALAALAQVRAHRPDDPVLRRREAALAERAGRPEQAREALRDLVRLLATRGDVAGTAAALVDAARLAGGREGAELAWRAFSLAGEGAALDQAIAADPTFAPARAARACRHGASPAEAAAALADAEAALAGDPLDPGERPALLRLSAHLAGATGDRELQRRRLAAACQLGQPTDEALAALCELQREAGDADGLLAALEWRLDTAPAPLAVALRLELAPLLSAHGRDAEAVARWREVLRLDRTQLPALRALLEPSRAAVLLEGEEPALRALLARHPDAGDQERAEAWQQVAAARRAGGDEAGAAAAVAEAERLRGEDDEGLERRAAAAAQAGDRAGAATALLRRARRGVARGEAQAAERLAEAGLQALEEGLGAALGADGLAALDEALVLPLEPEVRRAALAARCALAVAADDEPAEAALLAALVPLLPTGERPGRLVRLSALRSASGDAAGALAAAEEARALAPRSLEAVRQARRAAEGALRSERVAELLAEEAALDAPHAGALLLDRARLLVRLGQPAEADLAYTEALRALGPDLALAVEQARLRRAALPERSAAEVVEACARRCEEPATAARAALAAAALALQAADQATALRCARRAFARRREVPAEAGPLLARLLYEGGAFAEALVLHRALSEEGFAGFDDADVVPLCRQLAELATEAGELPLARAALDRLLTLRPQDAEAALARLALDPDRRRAALALAEVAARVRSDATRSALLARAGEVALAEACDHALGERLFDQALAEGALAPGPALALAHRRVAALAAGAARAPRGEARAVALVRLAGAEATLLGDDGRAEASLRAALEELPGEVAAEAALLALLARAGRRGDQARLLLARARREEAPAVRRALRQEAAALLEGAEEASDRSLSADVLAAVAQEAPDDLGAARAAAQALLAAGRREEATPHLAALVRADPGDEATAAALAQAYADRPRDRAELFLARAAHASGAARAARLRLAAGAFGAAGDPVRTRQVLAQLFDTDPADEAAFGAALAEAGDDVDRLDAVLAARAGAVAEDAAGCHRARADVLFATGRLEGAVEAYRSALALDGEDPAALATLGACLASLGGAAAAGEVDRRLCRLAEGRAALVPASLEAEARFRLGLAADLAADAAAEVGTDVASEAPADPQAGLIIEDLTRALWLAPEDPRADLAFAALVRAHLRAGEVEAALAAARARAERAHGRGDEAAELAALEAGGALAEQAGDRGPDAAALLDLLVARRAAAGEPLEAWMPLALRGAEAWRRLGDEARAQAVLALAGITAPKRPILAPVPTPPPESLEAVEPPVEAVGPGEPPPEAPVLVALPPVADAPAEVRTDEPQPDEPWTDEPWTDAAQADEPRADVVRPDEPQPDDAWTDVVQPDEPQTDELRPDAIRPDEPEPDEPRPDADQTAEPEPDEPQPDADQVVADQPEAPPMAADAPAPATDLGPAALAAAWLDEATALQAEGAGEAEVRAALETACAADPDAPAPWLALASLELAAGAPEAAARAHLAASIRTEGAPASDAALEAARLFEEAGLHAEAARAYRAANLAAPGSIPAALLQAEEALARGDLAAAAGCLGQVEAASLPVGALAGYHSALARLEPPRATTLLALVREHAAAGNRRSLAALAEEAEALLGPEPLRPYAASLGRASLEAGRPEAGWRWLSLAFREDPDDLTVARDLSRAAERTGRHAQEVALGARCADALAIHDPLAAAARLRHLARVADAKLADPERAAALLSRALELVPDELEAHRERWALWARVPACQPWALTGWTDAARRDPTDVTALDAVASLCATLAAGAPPELAARLEERARLAASLATFSAPGRDPAPPRLAPAVPDEARARLAAPGADGPLARLLSLLAPYLEPLLPADLARHGVTAADRLDAPVAPALREALETAGRLLGARPHVAFLVSRPGLEVALENTRPPALLLPAGAEALAAGEQLFLAARAVELLGHGWSLAGKFSPRDVGILLELACRFAGGAPPPLGLPAARAGAFLAALERSVPPSVAERARALGPAAAEALATTDLAALAAALRRTAARVALLLTGDPGAALAVLSHLSWPEPPAEPPTPLGQPDLRDLADLALSDPFLELRVAVVG